MPTYTLDGVRIRDRACGAPLYRNNRGSALGRGLISERDEAENETDKPAENLRLVPGLLPPDEGAVD